MEISDLRRRSLEILEDLWQSDYILLNPSFIHRLNQIIQLSFKYSVEIVDDLSVDTISVISNILILKSTVFRCSKPKEDKYDNIILEGVHIVGKSSFSRLNNFISEQLSFQLIDHVQNLKDLSVVIANRIKKKSLLLEYIDSNKSTHPFLSLLKDSLINPSKESFPISVKKDFLLRDIFHKIGLISLNLKEGKNISTVKDEESITNFIRSVSALRSDRTLIDTYYSEFKDFLCNETFSQLDLAYKIYRGKKEKRDISRLINIYEQRYAIKPKTKDCLKIIRYWNKKYYSYLKVVLSCKERIQNHMDMIKILNNFFIVYDLS